MVKKFVSVSTVLGALSLVPIPVIGGGNNSVNQILSTQQNELCTGLVKDATGEGLVGASIRVKGTPNGTISDINGKFSLKNVRKGDELTFSCIGYEAQTIRWDGNPIMITLNDNTKNLNEVVVTGYGGVQKAKTMTASVVTVDVGELAKLPVTTMAEGLGGRVPGVFTQQRSGAPGEKTKIWIRGGSNILYVIDDVVLDTSEGEDFFSRLRPDDIAYMSVLKDASATAVYGPRASNGVVVIQTKRGQDGAPRITLNQKVTIMTPSYRAKGMSSYEFAQARNEVAFANYEETPPFSNTELSKYYMGDLWQSGHSMDDILKLVNEKYNMGYTLQNIKDLFDPMKTAGGDIKNYYSTYDPWDMFSHVQPMYQTNVSIRGGGDRVKYYSSLGYLQQNGISSSFDYNQYNIILNTDAYLLNDKSLKFTFNLNGNMSNQKKPAAGESVFTSVMYGNWMPNRPAQWSTGLPRKGSASSLLSNGFNNVESYRFQLNAALKWDLPWIKGLSATASLNYTTSYSMQKKFSYDQENVYDAPYSTETSPYVADNANLYQYWSNYKLTTGIFQLDYNKAIGKHHFSLMANYQSQISNSNWNSQQKKGYPTTLAPQMSLGATWVSSDGNAEDWGSASFIGRATYDYDNKYLFQYSANYNGSLNYSPGQRWGFFQAVSLGWVMSEEAWFKRLINPKIVNMLKLRGGFGLVGNDDVGSPFSYLTQYAQNGNRILFGSNMASNVGWGLSSVANDLKWSSSKQYGLGVDFGFLNNRLNGSFDTYLYVNKGDVMNMTDQMIRTDILGMPNTPKMNAPFATTRKGGFEVALNWQDHIGQVEYHVGVNYSYWDQRTVRHTDRSTDYYYDGFNDIGRRYFSDVVYAMALQSNGLFGSWDQLYHSYANSTYNQTLGTPILVDRNGDGYTNDYYWTNKPGSTPLTQYGVTLGAMWKGFELEVFLQGAANVTGAMPSPFRNQQDYMWNYGQYGFQNAYTPSNPDVNAALPIPSPSNKALGYSYLDIWQFDASYLKMKNISLRYDLKKYVLKNIPVIQGCDLSFVVTNAFTWTKKSYPLKGLQDPEFITTGASIYNDNGQLGSYPTQRTYTFSVTFTL